MNLIYEKRKIIDIFYRIEIFDIDNWSMCQ